MTNSYENEVNSLVDGIMKVAEETAAAEGMEKEASIFNRRKKSEIAANKEKADSMFAGQGGDDSASDPRGKVQRKWKRIKAKFFKKANENTEEMIETIAAAADTEVDMLLDYIEKIASEEGLDGQDIVDVLYEDVDEDDLEYEDVDEDDLEYDDDDEEEYEEYGEEVEASMVNEAIEKIAAATDMDEDTVVDYISAVAEENEVDELEVLAALEDEADDFFEKEAARPSVLRQIGNVNRAKNRAVGHLLAGDGYEDYYDKSVLANAERAKLRRGDFDVTKRNLRDYYTAEEAAMDAGDKPTKAMLKRVGIPYALAGAGVGAMAARAAGQSDLAGAAAGAGGMGASLAAAYGMRKLYNKGKKAYNRKRLALDDADNAAEKQAFEILVDEAIEKVAYVAEVDGEDVIDYVEKLAYENDLDEIEVLAELEKEAAPKFITKIRDSKGGQKIGDLRGKIVDSKGGQKIGDLRGKVVDSKGGQFVGRHPKKFKVGAGLAGAAALGGGGYYLYNKRKNRAAEEAEKEAFEILIDEAIEKVAYVAGVDGEDVIDYVEKLAYENDVDEIEVLAELEKEAFDIKRTAGNVFVGRKNLDNFAAKKNMYEGMKSQRGLGAANDAFKASRKDFAKAGLGVAKRPAAVGAGLAAAGTGAYLLNKRRKRQAEESAE